MKQIAVGVDVGGSHISCMAFDLEQQKLLPDSFAESGIDNHAIQDVIIKIWGNVIKQCIEYVGIDNVIGIGFAMPGPFDYVNGISCFSGQNRKYEQTYGMNVRQVLSNFLNYSKPLKIRFINDATAFALGEAKYGKARKHHSILSVTLGTGFGSTFISNGLPVVDGNNVPEGGCLWNLPFENVIADDYFSTRGLLYRFEKKTGHQCQGVKDIVKLCADNSDAKYILEDFGKKMGEFLHPWIIKSSVQALVLGGNISRAYHFFGEALQNYLFNAGLDVNIIISDVGEKSAFIGSAILIDDTVYQQVLPVLKKM